MVEEKNLWQEDETSKDLKFYFSTIRRPFVICSGFILFFYLLSLVSFLQWTRESLSYCSWIVSLILILVVVLRVTKTRVKDGIHAVTVGFMAALLIGWWQVVLETIWFWSWWRLVDIFVEPLIIALIGGLIGIVIVKFYQLKNKVMVATAMTEKMPAPPAEEIKQYGKQSEDSTTKQN
ncbi:MAG: hypothetical protein WC310_00505 [Patescibacteria group bacterium]|jgi:hypothetical protein